MYPLSGVKANVGHLCKKLKNAMKSGLGIKFMAAVSPDFFLSADSGGSQRTGKCMYIKHGEIKGISLVAQSRTVAEGGKATVSACEPLCAIL